MIWTQPSKSGIGDRLIDITLLYAYARLLGEKLYCNWIDYQGNDDQYVKHIDAKHRLLDTKWEIISQYINLPPGIIINNNIIQDNIFNQILGGQYDCYQFFEKFVDSSKFELSTYLNSIKQTVNEFSFNINTGCPTPYIGLHIRRGDKVRNEFSDNAHILSDELYTLNALTFNAINVELKNYKNFYVCGDEDHKTKIFIDYIEKIGGRVIKLPEMEKHITTFFDLLFLSKSKKVITSMKHSSFSKFAALLGDIEYVTVYNYK
tara:strand:+ start:589 stop:1374 length:786 start_codon:yes stop_codon:yes gene_type:complete